MPELHFRVRWPDETESRCYSPSTSVKDFLVAGRTYGLEEFVTLSRQALQHASERVRQKYGYGCGHATYQISEIEECARRFSETPDARVTLVEFEP
jgi:uncharacterized repeat protein (TIGR04042 family)